MRTADYIVIAREDRTPGAAESDGAYSLCTRTVFASKVAAERYAASVSPSRQPIVVAGDFRNLRFTVT